MSFYFTDDPVLTKCLMSLLYSLTFQSKTSASLVRIVFPKIEVAIELSKSSILDPRLNGAFEYHCYQYKTPSPDNKLMHERRQ